MTEPDRKNESEASYVGSASSSETDTENAVSDATWAYELKAVAFDMDGLMVNTEELYSEVGDAVLRRRGKRFSNALKKRMMGLQPQRAFQAMIDHEGLTDTIETLAAESAELFDAMLEKELQVLPGLRELLDFLDTRSIRRCVATSSSGQFARKVLRLTELSDRFEFIMTAEDVANGKPAPDIYLEAAQRLSVEPARMLVLEDSQHGSKAGVSSGACTVAVPGDHSRDHDFSQVHFVAETLQDPRIRGLFG